MVRVSRDRLQEDTITGESFQEDAGRPHSLWWSGTLHVYLPKEDQSHICQKYQYNHHLVISFLIFRIFFALV